MRRRGPRITLWRRAFCGMATVTVLLVAVPATASASTVRSCGSIGFEPHTENGVFSIRAKGTTCRRARRVAAGARHTGATRGPYSYTALGYRCRGHLDESAVLPSAHWVCRRGAARVTFDRG